MELRSYHSVMAKNSYYRVDGSGRDTYISYDNGGYFKPMGKILQQNSNKIRPKSAVSQAAVKSLHYVSDGTGRDSYVKHGDGGLHSESSQSYYLSRFKNSLRSYEPLKVATDPYSWTQSCWQTPQKRVVNRNASKKIQDCVNRLYSRSSFA